MTMRGIPYTIGEAKLAAESGGMDPYSRELMQFLIEQIAVEREACAKIAEESGRGCGYSGGECCCVQCQQAEPGNIAAAIRARATTPPRTP